MLCHPLNQSFFGFPDVLIVAIVLALNCIYYITVFVAGDPILGVFQFLGQCVMGFESHREQVFGERAFLSGYLGHWPSDFGFMDYLSSCLLISVILCVTYVC